MGLDITGVGAVSDLANTVINKIWPDKTDQEKQQLAAAVMVVQGQIDINKNEAANPSVFVSGARPFIMWVCGVGLAMQFLVMPLLIWGAALTGKPLVLPSIDLSTLITLLLGMLGLGGMRTVEKLNGVARN